MAWRCTREVRGAHAGAISCVDFSPGGEFFATAGAGDRRAKLWRSSSPAAPETAPVATLASGCFAGPMLSVAIGINAQLAVAGSRAADGQPVVVDIATGMSVIKFGGHGEGGQTNAVRWFGQSGSLLVSAGFDRTVRIWDARGGGSGSGSRYQKQAVQVLRGATDAVSDVAVWPGVTEEHPQQQQQQQKHRQRQQEPPHEQRQTVASSGENWIVAACVDGSLRTYDLRRAEMACDKLGAAASHVSVTHDGNCLLVSSMDNTIRLLDRGTGELLGAYRGHTNSEFKVSSCTTFSDAEVISGSEDGGLVVWDIVAPSPAEPSAMLRAHAAPCVAITAHPSMNQVVTSSHDGSVRVWHKQDARQ